MAAPPNRATLDLIPRDIVDAAMDAADALFDSMDDAEYSALGQCAKDAAISAALLARGWVWLRAGKIQGDGSCKRCGGHGFIAAYKHVQGGVCYKCGGLGSKKRLISVRE